MCRNHNVILYEVKHHSSEYLEYNADVAQGIYERKQGKKGNTKKLLKNSNLLNYVIKRLKEGWSPELISGRLKTEELQQKYGYVSSETIYTYIYSQEMATRRLWMYLRRHRPKRYKQGRRRSRKGGTVKNMISISKQPEIVGTRNRVGDWESDSVQFSGQKGILSVQVERKTRQVRISKCLRTITFDRGTEGALHAEIAKELGVEIFFCHAYCSWEKGAVENRNMFIREYLPRNIKITEVSDEYIQEVQDKLNNPPMKCLGFRSPSAGEISLR